MLDNGDHGPDVLADTANPLAAPAVAYALDTIGAVTSSLAHAVGPVVDTVDTIATPLAPIVETIVAPIAPVLDTAAEHVGDALGAVTAPAVPIVDTVTSHVGDGVAAAPTLLVHDLATAADDLPLGGTDPAAGVQTLVSLVSISDMFDLRQAGVEPSDHADPGSSMLDALATDSAVLSPLLGDTDHHDDLLGSSGDHHHISDLPI